VTVQLSTVFLAPVRVGDFVVAGCEIVKVTRSMTFVEARLHVADAVVATANLILKALRPAE
jgi:acyl-coenzyme A thioesterase PaaI-like protein